MAQFKYTVKSSTSAYTPLAGATSLNAGKLWDGSTTFVLPLGFNFNLNGVTTQKLYVTGSIIYTGRAAKQSGLVTLNTTFIDRGTIQGASRSQVRYNVSGAAGFRIFKLEYLNAGFEEEFDQNNEQKDSINMQVWFHEGSNAVEYRYGSSIVSYFQEYFGDRILSGYIKNVDTLTGDFDKFYLLNGTATAPVLDSMTTFDPSKGLRSVPVAGTVFRFAPKGNATAVERIAAGSLASVFPTRCQNGVQVRNTSSATLRAAIYSLDGRLMIQADAQPGDTGIDLSTVPTGQYVVRITNADRGLCETQRIEKL
jgi:hypothetical protein